MTSQVGLAVFNGLSLTFCDRWHRLPDPSLFLQEDRTARPGTARLAFTSRTCVWCCGPYRVADKKMNPLATG